MTSTEYHNIIVFIDKALGVSSTSADRVGDLSFRADLMRVRGKAEQEMTKAAGREQAAKVGAAFEWQHA